jgi:hypothetical protein
LDVYPRQARLQAVCQNLLQAQFVGVWVVGCHSWKFFRQALVGPDAEQVVAASRVGE